ncbi:protein translocase subunit SecD [Pelagicoccus sp. SDUM812002]|uniref:protein translocase subunit SecD n=1 Tax=Pelagicoccus sp. SDUM812002 TaxID=3041266 RepID=UPI00281078F8|nr:protein translocase subunit SecD [Pelagicoccus sp. SDUM812002]MDQ8187751.1 protein translocase subunit SecD [Pelagicoccus sp. SDUM812002]
MSGKYFWKLALTAVIVAFCLSYLVPMSDQDFAEHVTERSGDPEFAALVERAKTVSEESQGSDRALSVYMALKSIANEERIDISQYFEGLELESSLRNVEKRNNILLPELLEDSKANLKKGLDIQGGISVTFEVDPVALAEVPAAQRNEKLADAINIIERRVNTYGVSEPIVRPVGENRIEVQIAGVNTKDNPDIIETIKAPARLEFREVHPNADPRTDPRPTGYIEMEEVDDNGDQEIVRRYYVKRLPALTGKYVSDAFPRTNQVGGLEVILQFNDEGAELFADVTERLGAITERGIQTRSGEVGLLAIVLDGQLQSAPRVGERIAGGSAQITGNYTQREAINLANTLNNPLELPLEVVEMYEVGPSMAKDSIDSGVKASIIGVTAVSAFMIAYFMIGGVVALISVIFNVVIVLGVLASYNATLTLPGIAGIVLTVGMAVDANILIFERIREELRAGKSLKSAVEGGFDKVFSTIFDANVTTLLVSFVMLGLGTGPVKGFGLTLAIGVITTMFCALVVTRLMLELLFTSGALKKFKTLSLFNASNIDFMKFRKPAFLASWCLVAVGVIVLATKWDNIWGIDFTGGDEVIMSFTERLDEAQIRDALAAADIGEVNPLYQAQLGGGDELLRIQTGFEKGVPAVEALIKAFPEAGYEMLGKNEIGPSVGAEIQKNALLSIALALGLILLYIAFRFEIGYGIGAVVATIHDILLTIGVFVLVPGHQFTAPMVAAILLIVGYSLNDTIVVFDRIREELTLRPTSKLREVINIAMNAVITRSVLTSITTLLASVSLMVFGKGVINDIAFTFTIGIITGTFSSIFIASPVFYFYHKGDRRSVESSHDIVPEYDWQVSTKVASSGTSKDD